MAEIKPGQKCMPSLRHRQPSDYEILENRRRPIARFQGETHLSSEISQDQTTSSRRLERHDVEANHVLAPKTPFLEKRFCYEQELRHLSQWRFMITSEEYCCLRATLPI